MFRTEKHLSRLKKASFYSLSIVMALSAVAYVVKPAAVNAATLGKVLVRFDRLQTSQGTTGTVCAQPTTASAEASVQVVFPTGYTLGAAGTFTVNTTNLNWPASAAAWTGIGTANNVTSQTVTFPSGDLASTTTLYCFNWTNTAAVAVKSSATSSNTGTVTTRDSVPTTIDTASYSTVSLASDQIGVSASVPQAFTFALSASSDGLGSLTTANVVTGSSPTVTVNTNAKNGWMAWAQDANTGLKSPSAGNYVIPSKTPGTNSTLATSTEFANMGVTGSQSTGSGSMTIDPAFLGGSLGKGGGLDTSLRPIASATGSSSTVLTLANNAIITATTPAATDYADTITLVGAALF